MLLKFTNNWCETYKPTTMREGKVTYPNDIPAFLFQLVLRIKLFSYNKFKYFVSSSVAEIKSNYVHKYNIY